MYSIEALPFKAPLFSLSNDDLIVLLLCFGRKFFVFSVSFVTFLLLSRPGGNPI